MTEIGPDPSKRQVVQPMDHGAKNLLNQETSPYLLQHQDNPVHWRGWNEAAFAEAKAAGKPVLLSVGYAACHWCHVMAHESFENPDIAAVMNELFVNIKVDREERPDLDRVYQQAHQLLNGRPGGWPLTVILTPDDHLPYFSGTYFPKTPRHNLPGFAELLERLAAVWHERRDDVRAQNAQLRPALRSGGPKAGVTGYAANPAPLDEVRDAILRAAGGRVTDYTDGDQSLTRAEVIATNVVLVGGKREHAEGSADDGDEGGAANAPPPRTNTSRGGNGTANGGQRRAAAKPAPQADAPDDYGSDVGANDDIPF